MMIEDASRKYNKIWRIAISVLSFLVSLVLGNIAVISIFNATWLPAAAIVVLIPLVLLLIWFWVYPEIEKLINKLFIRT